jgi:hypothetical protein
MTTTADFHAAAHTMIEQLRSIARENRNVWHKDGIMSPLGPLVVVEYISGVNDAFKIDGSAPICTHWQGVSLLSSVMTAAGYVRK